MLRWVTGRSTLIATGTIVLLGACAVQDEAETVPPATEVTPSTTPTTGMFTDATIHRVLEVVNQGEIQEAQLAQSKAQNQEVRSFAEMLLRDHQQMSTQLQSPGAPGTGTQPPASGTGTQPQGTGTQPPATGAGTGTPSGTAPSPSGTAPPLTGTETATTPGATTSPTTLVGSPEEIIQRLQQESDSIRNELQRLSGAEFDRAYIDRQVQAHETALELIDQQLLQSAQDQQLRQTLESARTTIQSHLEQARQLQQRVGSGTTGTPQR